MGFNDILTKLFGNKSQRDLKEITPYVDKIKAVYPQLISIFILPPDSESWLERLRSRNTESAEALQIRIRTAAKELAEIPSFDYVVINEEIDRAAEDILTILRAERMRSSDRKVSFSCHE